MVDNLAPVYKNIGTPEAKNEWIDILQNNPTDAIDAYHDALCKDQKENGYCDLLKLFRILGALEILKNQKDNNTNQLKNEFKELKETVISALPEGQEKVVREHAILTEENKKLKEEEKQRKNKEKDDLEKINKLNSVFKELQEYIVFNMESINTGYSDVNDKVKEALKQLKNAEEETIRE